MPSLKQLPSVIRVELERNSEPGMTSVILSAPENAPVERELFTLLSGMQTPLLRLAAVEDSLEDIFLKATQLAG